MNQILCPKCGTSNPSESFFCSHCGQKLKEQPLSTSVGRQIWLYILAFFVPPSGLFSGLKYLKQEDQKSRYVGWALIGTTVVSLLISVWAVIAAFNTANSILNAQLDGLQIGSQPSNSGFIEKQLGL